MVNELVEECNETIDEVKLTENENSHKCNSCILYIVLFSIFFTFNAGIGAYFSYYKYINRNKKMLLDIMIMFIKQKIINIKWEKSNKLTLKIELIIFTMTLSVSKFWCQVIKNWQKIIQRHWHLQHWVYYI